MAGQRIHTELAALLWCGEQLFGEIDRQLVRRQVVGQVGALADRIAVRIVVVLDHALEVRTVTAHAHMDFASFGVVEQTNRVDGARIDVFEVLAHHLLQATRARHRTLGTGLAAEVEALQPISAPLTTSRDRVEIVFHACGEVEVHQTSEVRFQQRNHRERHPRRHESAATLVDVTAVEDRLDDRRIRGRPTDSQLFERLDQRRLGESSRRVGRVTVGIELGGRHRLAGLQRG
ncbi:unannotated protein [freshwater metagenome]|uniref:Unannotated protein n=1 Tax=freshwater metagenome TaxID=449393 RepID=A0A6J7HKY9_9ZZZZ